MLKEKKLMAIGGDQVWHSITALVILLFFSSFSSCQGGDREVLPPIKKEEMVGIIAEALILEPAIRELPKIKQDSFAPQIYKQILLERGYTMPDFMESMQWLQADPERLTNVYEKVMAELTKKEDEVHTTEEEEEEEEEEEQ